LQKHNAVQQQVLDTLKTGSTELELQLVSLLLLLLLLLLLRQHKVSACVVWWRCSAACCSAVQAQAGAASPCS
jgi:hypothetical protein